MKPLIIDARNPEFYNPVINSNLDFHQRLGAGTVTRTNLALQSGYDADRYFASVSSGGAARSITIQRSATLPTLKAPATFSRQVTNDTAIASFAASEEIFPLGHSIEGLFYRPLAGAPITVGFWFFSSVGGVVPVAIQRAAFARSYVTTINATANVYQYHVVHIPADTGGPAFSYGNSDQYRIGIAGLSGTNRQAANLNTWLTADVWTHASATNWAAFVGSVLRFSQLQVRIGYRNADEMQNSYIPFSFHDERGACQRYYYRGHGYAICDQTNANIRALFGNFPVAMRANPLASSLSLFVQINGGGGDFSFTGQSILDTGLTGAANVGGGVSGRFYRGDFEADAEF